MSLFVGLVQTILVGMEQQFTEHITHIT